MAWNGKDQQVRQAAKDNSAIFVKCRKTYIFAGFSTVANRNAFKTALSQIAGIQYANSDVNPAGMFVVRITES